MKKTILGLTIVFTLLLCSQYKQVEANIALSCRGCVLMEAGSNRVLYDKNAHEQMRIASITKIMTALVAIEEGNINDYVEISEQATKQIGSSLYVKQGEHMRLIDLIYGLLLRSGNDAAYAIAEHVAGDVDEFVNLMNERAKAIGMHNTVFENPSGLDETSTNLSTAYDMALLMSVALDNPIYVKINGASEHRAETKEGSIHVFYNKHRLINRYDYITGGKTGYTVKAKRTLVTSARQNGMDLVVVTLNDPNDWDDHLKLFEYGFSQYENKHLMDDGILYVKELDKLLYLSEEIDFPMVQGEEKDLEFIIDRNDDKYYLRLMHKEHILLSRELDEYNYLHDDPQEFFKKPVRETLKEIFGDGLW